MALDCGVWMCCYCSCLNVCQAYLLLPLGFLRTFCLIVTQVLTKHLQANASTVRWKCLWFSLILKAVCSWERAVIEVYMCIHSCQPDLVRNSWSGHCFSWNLLFPGFCANVSIASPTYCTLNVANGPFWMHISYLQVAPLLLLSIYNRQVLLLWIQTAFSKALVTNVRILYPWLFETLYPMISYWNRKAPGNTGSPKDRGFLPAILLLACPEQLRCLSSVIIQYPRELLLNK